MMKNNRYRKLAHILYEHRGAANAITASEMSKMVNLPGEATQRITRDAIWTVARRYALPIVSCAKGYYIADTEEEVEEFCEAMQKRIDGMSKTVDLVKQNWSREARRRFEEECRKAGKKIFMQG